MEQICVQDTTSRNRSRLASVNIAICASDRSDSYDFFFLVVEVVVAIAFRRAFNRLL